MASLASAGAAIGLRDASPSPRLRVAGRLIGRRKASSPTIVLRPEDDEPEQPHAAISRRLSLREVSCKPVFGNLGKVEHPSDPALPCRRHAHPLAFGDFGCSVVTWFNLSKVVLLVRSAVLT